MKVKRNKGFTLIEIVVVLVILAVLAAFTIPTYLGFIGKTHQTEDITNLGFLNRVTTYYGASITIQNKDLDSGYALQFDRGLNAIVIRQRINGNEQGTSY